MSDDAPPAPPPEPLPPPNDCVYCGKSAHSSVSNGTSELDWRDRWFHTSCAEEARRAQDRARKLAKMRSR